LLGLANPERIAVIWVDPRELVKFVEAASIRANIALVVVVITLLGGESYM
jgi:hypothetical protein